MYTVQGETAPESVQTVSWEGSIRSTSHSAKASCFGQRATSHSRVTTCKRSKQSASPLRPRFSSRGKTPLSPSTGLALLLGHVFADVDKEPTVFCVLGDTIGILYAMKDIETIYFVRQTGEVGRLVRSVCTGTLLLGQAGLTCGYRVTSRWVTKPLREAFDAIPVDERVVEDRNRSTRAGVTAGIDFGLMLLAKMRDEDYAKSVQLLAEDDPLRDAVLVERMATKQANGPRALTFRIPKGHSSSVTKAVCETVLFNTAGQ